MSRAEIRKLSKESKEDMPEFIVTKKTLLSRFDTTFQAIVVPGQQGSIDYSIDEILNTIFLKNISNITSMRK